MSSEADGQRLRQDWRRRTRRRPIMAMITVTATTTSIPRRPHFIFKYVFSHDHKIIGIQFLFSGLIFFVLGGLLAMAVRWQLAWPWKPMPILSPGPLV